MESEIRRSSQEERFAAFVEIARASNVPKNILEAKNNIIEKLGINRDGETDLDLEARIIKPIEIILQRKFKKPTEGFYASLYLHAIAYTKEWDSERRLTNYCKQNIDQCIENEKSEGLSIEEILESDIYKEPQELLEKMDNVVKDWHTFAFKYFNMLISLETSVKRNGNLVNRILDLTIPAKDRPLTMQDFNKLKREIETYFADPVNIDTISVIANSNN